MQTRPNSRYISGAAFWLAFCLSVGSLVLLWRAQAQHGGLPTDFDRSLMLAVHAHASQVWDKLTYVLAFLGSVTVAFAAALTAFVIAWVGRRKRGPDNEADRVLRRAGQVMPVACVGGVCLFEILKHIAHRARPQVFVPLFGATGYSFPSGHAFMGVVVFGLIAFFAFYEAARRGAPFLSRIIFAVLLCLIGLCIGLSRVYAGVHYPTDVLAGWASGGAWLLLCLRLRFNGLKNKMRNA